MGNLGARQSNHWPFSIRPKLPPVGPRLHSLELHADREPQAYTLSTTLSAFSDASRHSIVFILCKYGVDILSCTDCHDLVGQLRLSVCRRDFIIVNQLHDASPFRGLQFFQVGSRNSARRSWHDGIRDELAAPFALFNMETIILVPPSWNIRAGQVQWIDPTQVDEDSSTSIFIE